jgi:hypothetical protein
MRSDRSFDVEQWQQLLVVKAPFDTVVRLSLLPKSKLRQEASESVYFDVTEGTRTLNSGHTSSGTRRPSKLRRHFSSELASACGDVLQLSDRNFGPFQASNDFFFCL